MARGENWSEREVREAVRSYLYMFERELNDEPYNKAEHRRVLLVGAREASSGST